MLSQHLPVPSIILSSSVKGIYEGYMGLFKEESERAGTLEASECNKKDWEGDVWVAQQVKYWTLDLVQVMISCLWVQALCHRAFLGFSFSLSLSPPFTPQHKLINLKKKTDLELGTRQSWVRLWLCYLFSLWSWASIVTSLTAVFWWSWAIRNLTEAPFPAEKDAEKSAMCFSKCHGYDYSGQLLFPSDPWLMFCGRKMSFLLVHIMWVYWGSRWPA